MLSTQRGSVDGVNINEYLAGKEYEIAEELGSVFVGKHWAEVVIDKQVIDTPIDGTDQPEASEVKPKAGSNRRRR